MTGKVFNYNPQMTPKENIARLLLDAGYPEELLDDVIIDCVALASASEFNGYTNKIGNTALKVSYQPRLRDLTKLDKNVHFYQRVPPIPDVWRSKVMYVLDTQTKNTDIAQIIKGRWAYDGYPFVGEQLTFEPRNRNGVLNYGRNVVDVRPTAHSYGLCGIAQQQVQYFVDLSDSFGKFVVTVNPFINMPVLTKKSGYTEIAVPAQRTVKETENKITERFLKETYGNTRGTVVHEEIVVENIDLVRSPTFEDELASPDKTPEQQLEFVASAEYVESYLYQFSQYQTEDDTSRVVGDVRLMVGKSHLAKLVKESDYFQKDVEEAPRFNDPKVKSFILEPNHVDHVQFNITLGKFTSRELVEQTIKSMIKNYFGRFANYVDVNTDTFNETSMTFVVTPSSVISDYVMGKIYAVVNYSTVIPTTVDNGHSTHCACDGAPSEPNDGRLVISRNLNGFSGVSLD